MALLTTSLVSSSILIIILLLLLSCLSYNKNKNEQADKESIIKHIHKGSYDCKNLTIDFREKFCYNLLKEYKNGYQLKCLSIVCYFILLKNDCDNLIENKNICSIINDKREELDEGKLLEGIIKNSVKSKLGKSLDIETEILFGDDDLNERNFKEINDIVNDEDEDLSLELSNNNEDNDVIKETDGNNSSSIAYCFVCFLLVLSTIASIVEFFREKNHKKGDDVQETGSMSETYGGAGRRMSIVDLTVSRHARKESLSQRESVISNSGIFRPPPLIRRSSFPAQVPEVVRGRVKFTQRQQTWSPQGTSPTSSRRISVDYTDDDSSAERKRKPPKQYKKGSSL